MISYEPFWNMMKQRGISTYALENKYGLTSSEIHRLKHDHNFTINFIDYLCILFDCNIEDIVIHCVVQSTKKKVKKYYSTLLLKYYSTFCTTFSPASQLVT